MSDIYFMSTILHNITTAIDYVIYLQNQSRKQEEQLENLEKEVKALKIMKEWVHNYIHSLLVTDLSVFK